MEEQKLGHQSLYTGNEEKIGFKLTGMETKGDSSKYRVIEKVCTPQHW